LVSETLKAEHIAFECFEPTLKARLERGARFRDMSMDEYVAHVLGWYVDNDEEDMIVHPKTGELLADEDDIRPEPDLIERQPASTLPAETQEVIRAIPLVPMPWISDERWKAMGDSQAKAAELVKAGRLEEALDALREGTWKNPEKTLQGLVADLQKGGN
jgi:hypothetical protein